MKNVGRALIFTSMVQLTCCGGSNSSPAPAAPTPTPAPAPGGTSSVTVTMPPGSEFLTQTAYSPNPLTVSVGTTVTFVNNDIVAHTATSQNNLWDTGDIPSGQSHSLTFQSTGSFPYYCIYHPRMVGTITVH
jgi:plastocyanin